MKVAIVTDWLTNMSGAERVVLELHKMFPSAPIYTSLYDKKRMQLFDDADIRTGFIQKIPFAKKKHQLFPILRKWYFQNLDLSQYDLVISASGAEAKAVRTPKGTLHINYCHSPTHYYWVRPDEYLKNPGFGFLNPIMRIGLKILMKRQKVWDYLAAQEPDIMLANSTVTKERIKKFYDRDADVVFPPVDTERFNFKGTPPHRHGFVIVGRQVHYKRIDLAVAACTQLNLPLKVIGWGPEHQKLVKMAGPTITFLENVSDEDMVYHLSSAEAFIFPNLEDFGIAAVEAMSAGTPVIAYRNGGSIDTVVEGKTGVFFDKQNVRSLDRAIKSFDASKFNPEDIKKHAQKFDTDKFRKGILEVIKSTKY